MGSNNRDEETKANKMHHDALISRAPFHTWSLHAQTAVDAGDFHTWLINVILMNRKIQIYPQLESQAGGKKMALKSGISNLHLRGGSRNFQRGGRNTF